MKQQSLLRWTPKVPPPSDDLIQYSLWLWIRDSSRRYLLSTELHKPLTSHQLCVICQRHNPAIRTQDVHAQLKEMMGKGLVQSVNHRVRRGRLYYLTALGRDLLKTHAGLIRQPLDQTIDWDVFGQVVCGRLRQAILTELEQPKLTWWNDCTPTGIKKRLLPHHPSSLSTVARTLLKLESDGLVEACGHKGGGQQRLYALTASGRRVLRWLNR